jgi:uncharacterized protein with von Willebrand factor type A (vWA) domain
MRDDGVFVLPGGRAPDGVSAIAQKCAIAEYWLGGGTNFVNPLEFAIGQIEDTAGEWAQAAIVMVTDGCAPVPADWAATFRARCQAKNVRVHGVLLDLGSHYLESMKAFCDQAWTVSTFDGAHTAKPIFMQLTQ